MKIDKLTSRATASTISTFTSFRIGEQQTFALIKLERLSQTASDS
jgi:hypothetical protein